MQKNINTKMFAARAVLCFFLIMMLLLTTVLRVSVIATSDYSQIQTQQISYSIDVCRLRGTIYDCNMVPFTNNLKQTVAVVSPTPKGIMAVSSMLEGKQLESALETLKKGKPVVCNIDHDFIGEGIATTTFFKRYGDKLHACHIIGYTDSTGHGVTGLELAYDQQLYSDKKVTAYYLTNGKGDVLKGIDPYFENDLTVTLDGVVTTLDINIQNITENAAAKMNSGCAIVAEVGSGKIRAMASVPEFDISNISKSLNAENSPMLNRNLSTFNVGSVFKPCVAISAIENGFVNNHFYCDGSLEIGNRIFRCHNLSGHGDMDLHTSLAQSCNCYFYSLALKMGGDSIYKNASKLSISAKIKIADNIYTAEGSLPNSIDLYNDGTVANLSIGQGNLMSSPVAMLNLYQAIAGDGSYFLPSIVEKTIKEGKESYYDKGSPTRVMSSTTAETLRQYLQSVITDGTGTEALPQLCTAAGKTATAQTGRYCENGEEITNSWFCGFFPVENPQYVVVVMSDSRLRVSTASVFAQIADGIIELKGKNS